MSALYNEKDPFAAEWLRKLIAANLIAPGDVDERSIEDVIPLELAKYVQCHFFAGIGVWSYTMRRAGWPDDRYVWTGSCPCQPLSSAGQRKGHADQRHLWPAFYRLIAECGPTTVFGEQVASKDGREWLAGVRADLEDSGYACGSADLCAAGVSAPHPRRARYVNFVPSASVRVRGNVSRRWVQRNRRRSQFIDIQPHASGNGRSTPHRAGTTHIPRGYACRSGRRGWRGLRRRGHTVFSAHLVSSYSQSAPVSGTAQYSLWFAPDG